jgi:hypothetical protein
MDYTSDGTSSGDNSRQNAMSEDLESGEAPKKKAKKTKKATGRYKVGENCERSQESLGALIATTWA